MLGLWSIWKVKLDNKYYLINSTSVSDKSTGIDYEGKEYLITLGNDNMIFVEMLLPNQKGKVTPLFPEPLVKLFLN